MWRSTAHRQRQALRLILLELCKVLLSGSASEGPVIDGRRSPDGTEAYADSRHTSQTLSGDVNRGAASVSTTCGACPVRRCGAELGCPRYPRCPSSLNRRNHCWPNKRNRNETWGGASELSGVRQAVRCLYDAGEPSWA